MTNKSSILLHVIHTFHDLTVDVPHRQKKRDILPCVKINVVIILNNKRVCMEHFRPSCKTCNFAGYLQHDCYLLLFVKLSRLPKVPTQNAFANQFLLHKINRDLNEKLFLLKGREKRFF